MRSAWSTNHAATPTIAEGTSRLSAGQAIRLHLVSASLGDEADGQKLNIRLAGRIGWVAPPQVDGTAKAIRPVSRRWNRGQRTTRPRRQSPKAQTGFQPGGLSQGAGISFNV